MRIPRRSKRRRTVDTFLNRDQRVLATKQRIARLLEARDAASEQGAHPPVAWLVPCRDELRELRRDRAWDLAALLQGRGLTNSLSPDAQALIVWLIGRRVSPRALYGLDHWIDDPSPAVRKRVAKALRRAEAWALLRRMAGRWPDDAWVQRFAAEPAAESHSDRLTRFVHRNIAPAAPSPAPPMPLWARDRYWFLTPPKRADYLRRMLLRIRRWARGRAA